MEKRSYEFFKVGIKMMGDTEYTFYNDPFLTVEAADVRARNMLTSHGLETVIARFQIVQKYKP